MPVLRKVECRIHTEKGRLTEYEGKGVSGQNDGEITRHLDITGAEGQRFWIEIQALPDFEWGTAAVKSLVPFVTVDGVDLSGHGSIESAYPTCQYHGPRFSELEGGEYIPTINEMFFQPLKLGKRLNLKQL